jgi:PBP1b-binding outer membrane lipoprotein LpoB
MLKISLLAMVLLSLLVIGGCAKGGNGIVPTVSVSITTPANANPSAIYPTQTVTLTAMTTDPTNAPITWTLSGPGSILSTTPASSTAPATATYQAPKCVSQSVCIGSTQPVITAAMTAVPTIMDAFGITVVDITTEVAPSTLSVGNGLSQQFTAVAVPDDAPQTMTWSCTANGNQCVNFGPDPNVLGAYLYTASDNCSGKCVQISAASIIDSSGCTPNPNYCTIATVSLSPRLNGTYAFQFSGYDNSNNPIAMAGTFTAVNGTITAPGVEEVLTKSGPSGQSPIQITGGSYTPSSNPYNSNNAGTLTLLPSGSYPYKFQVVLDGNGDLEMIESDSNGTGSGIAKISNAKNFTGTTDQTYAFGFTGVDVSGTRVGYVGVLPMNGSGSIGGGQVDVNDNGTTGSYPSVAGSYSEDACNCGLWHVTGVTLATGTTLDFDFFVASGSSSKTNPLTFYAISTDAVGASHPAAVSGTMVLQDSSETYNNGAFNATSVSALTGVSGSSTNVALVLGSANGDGGFSGTFDQNTAGNVLTAVQFQSSAYSYTAGSTTNGRYVFQMLGNPTTNPVVPPIPFVLYASGANAGFLLDQSSSSVMTGTMNPQGNVGLGLSGSELPGTYAAATTANASPAIAPIAANLFTTWAQLSTGAGSCISECLTGTQYPGSQTMTGTYTLSTSGTGSIALTAPSTDSSTYVIYAVNTTGCKTTAKNANPVCAVQSFYIMGSCTVVAPATSCSTGPASSILYAQE